MLKIMKKILSILLLAIVFISNTGSIIKAAYEFTESYIVQIGEAPYHLKYYNESKGMYTYSICAIVGHYENGKFFPAYCLNRDLNGVGKVDSYFVDVDSVVRDNKVWRAVKNGYPYKSAGEMGLQSDFDAFAVTKFAVYCLTGQADINLYIADEGDEEGQAMLRALHNLVDIGLNGSDAFSDELKITKVGDLVEEDDYHVLTYKVNAGSTISSYTIKSVTGLLDGDLVTDVNGNIKNRFNSGENFKVKILKSNLNLDKDINIEVSAELKDYPMFYGKTRISGTQNYLLTADSYQDVNANISTTLIAPKKGDLKINKVDKDNHNITMENVEFKLYDESKNLVGTYKTDKNGKIEIKDLKIGKYLLKETSVDKWYNLAEDAEIEIKWNETVTKTIENELKKSQIKITKVDKDNSEIKIPGVVFEVQDVNGNILEKVTTDENGEVLTKKYPLKEYEKLRLHEVETDKWYNINDEIQEVTLEENKLKTVTLQNEKKKGQIRVIKVDLDNQEVKLQGVTFNVIDEAGNVVDTLTTNEQGEAITKLLPIDQNYLIQEISTKENYVLSKDTKTVTLSEDKITDITFENEKKKGQIRVIKVDAENNEVKLANVEFNVLNKDGKIVDTLVTDNEGIAITKRLPIDDEYTICETKTDEKYVLSEETRTVTLEEDKITDITFENERIKGTIKIIKTTAEKSDFSGLEKGSPLEGVEFEVLNLKGKLLQTITTNEQGIATTTRLEKGTYKIREKTTNEWYLLDEREHSLEIKENNQVVTLNVENTPANPEEEITKTGPYQAKPNEQIQYKINIKNSGNVKLDNFTWEDQIPTDYIRVTKINTGTFNKDGKYNFYYKTNISNDYILFLEDIKTNQSEEIDFTKELASNEYITNIKIDFGTVDVGFETQTETSIFATVNSNTKRDDIFENKVTLTSNYNNYKLTKDSSSKTKIYKILPVTGM